ncbi:MAG TPA: tetratricopeptide repeat protein [Planctomycetota bacterium]|nr:tetratricopeptide repeat protein [Planctomycetota bacterium]HRR82819.1 tetratricopeptide repeat protein [Planctomycetota bacterium]HRT97653.1 tetratricopeptide repeat protein [Planctomycetota bacterium]
MPRVPKVSPPFLVLLLAAALGAAGEPPLPADPAALVPRLGDPACAARDAALEALVALGPKAVPALQKAAEGSDAEVRWRALAALRRIHWQIGPKLAERIGDLMDGFEKRPIGQREMVCRDLAIVGLSDSIPTLKRILATDPSNAVRQAAARALVLLGDEGIAALLEAGVKTDGLNPYTVAVRIHLGNSYLERSEYEKALEQYKKAIELEPKNSIVLYNVACTYSRMKKIEEALDALERAVECGYRDVGWMEKDADLDNLRDEARYKALVRRLREKAD